MAHSMSQAYARLLGYVGNYIVCQAVKMYLSGSMALAPDQGRDAVGSNMLYLWREYRGGAGEYDYRGASVLNLPGPSPTD
jgi:hypothetical protein